MRHPLLRLVQLLLALFISATGFLGIVRERAAAAELPELRIAIAGEKEVDPDPFRFVAGGGEDDGPGWEAVDVLRDTRGVDRFQLLVEPREDVRVRVEAVDAAGPQTLFPRFNGDGLLRAGTTWSLPGRDAFFGVSGAVKLRVTVTPLKGDGGKGCERLEDAGELTTRLSDGTPARFSTAAFRCGAASLEFAVHD